MSPAQLPGVSRTAKSVLIWTIRIVIYGLAIYLSFWVIMPAMGSIPGLLVSALFAAAAIGAEVLLTSKLNGRGLERTAAQRVLIIDRMLSPQGESLSDRHTSPRELEEADIVDAEVISPADEDRPQLWK